jgi:lipopolysaccharide transport system permease protein
LLPMLARYTEIVFYRAAAELRRDAARMYLGVLWWFLEPILYMSVFYLVFGVGLRKGGADFVVYLLSGLIVWRWFDGSVRSSAGSIVTSVGLMQQVYLPKILLPAVVMVMQGYKFAIIFGVFLLFLVGVWGATVTQYWLALPLILILQLVFICAISGLVAGVIPLVPDLKYMVDFGMTLLFFVSGIFFDIHDLTPAIQEVLSYNPMVIFIEAHRQVLLYGHWPQWALLSKVTVVSLVLLGAMIGILGRCDRYYPRVVG